MTSLEEFKKILQKERKAELLVFARNISKEDRKALVPELKPVFTEYLDFQLVSGSYKQKASSVQREILELTAFLFFNRKDFEKHGRWGQLLHKNVLDQVLPWYCPSWFSDYLNGFVSESWIPYTLTYELLMYLTEQGFVTPSRELIARTLPQHIFDFDEKRNRTYRPENLLVRKVTLDEHLWLIFELESHIHGADSFYTNEKATHAPTPWIEALVKLSHEGKLDRYRILKESILATTRNFNKNQSGWFAELFVNLEPTPQEISGLQSELLIAFNSPHSKAVNTALNAFKKIADDPKFDIDNYLLNAPLLLSSDAKSVVTSSLILFDKLSRKFKKRQLEIAAAAAQAFVHADDEIQTRVAKIISRIDSSAPGIREVVSRYESSMLMNAKTLLADFLPDSVPATPVDSDTDEPVTTQNEKRPVKYPETIDELVFLSSEVFDNNKSYNIDLLAAGIVNLQHKMDRTNVGKFEPALQRAYKMVISDWTSAQGYLDHLVASFFIDFTRLLIKRFPEGTQPLRDVHQFFLEKNEELKKKHGKYYTQRILNFDTWSVHSGDSIYTLYRQILAVAKQKFISQDTIPLLSTPTTEPAFISLEVLASRLALYQEKKAVIDPWDFQVALSRCNFSGTDAEKVIREKNIDGEPSSILKFITTRSEPEGVHSPGVWLTAAMTRLPVRDYQQLHPHGYENFFQRYSGFAWRSYHEHYYIDKYNYKTRKYDKTPAERKKLEIIRTQSEHEGFMQKLLRKFLKIEVKKKNDVSLSFIYDFTMLRADWVSAESNDIERLTYLFPNNPEPLIVRVIERGLKYNNFVGEPDRRIVSNCLQALLNLSVQYSEIGHLLIATCMLSADKTVKSLAAELWIDGVSKKTINSQRVGEIIGLHQSIEFAPMKRFTDLLNAGILQTSTQHRRALETLLSAMLSKLPDEPVNGLKKLLELFAELVYTNQTTVDDDQLKRKLLTWQATESLAKPLKSLLATKV